MTTGFRPKYFNPAAYRYGTSEEQGRVSVQVPGKNAYVYSEAIILAVNVAMATQRPILIAGEPGTGKTTLAANVAQVVGWKFYESVVTSRTKARDLMWSFDTLRRLADAHTKVGLLPQREYLEPRALWWAFNAASAEKRGAAKLEKNARPAVDPGVAALLPAKVAGSVVLIDEIDKAEPDVPNDLLEALDTESFKVVDLESPLPVKGDRSRVLLCITTNQERELPAAFVRRCVVLSLDKPTEDWLVTIAKRRFGAAGEKLHRDIARRVMQLREAARKQGLREPSTAEYLDAVKACSELSESKMSNQWELIEAALLWKHHNTKAPTRDEVAVP